jgi:hypothetical protein
MAEQYARFLVPPGQQFKHQARYFLGRRRHVTAHADVNGPVLPRCPLVHHVARDDLMQPQNLLVGDRAFAGVLLDEPKSGEIVQHLTFGAGGHGGQFPALLDRADLSQRQRIALDGRRGMGVAGAGILLQRGNPAHLHRGGQDALAQCGNLLDVAQQRRAHAELRLITHAGNLMISQA